VFLIPCCDIFFAGDIRSLNLGLLALGILAVGLFTLGILALGILALGLLALSLGIRHFGYGYFDIRSFGSEQSGCWHMHVIFWISWYFGIVSLYFYKNIPGIFLQRSIEPQFGSVQPTGSLPTFEPAQYRTGGDDKL
jgi:hypothetical protein